MMRTPHLDTSTALEVAERLQDAAIDPRLWPEALEYLRRVFDASTASLVSASLRPPHAVQNRVRVGDRIGRSQVDLLDGLHSGDPRVLWSLENPGRAGASNLHIGMPRMHNSEIYRRILKDLDAEYTLLLPEQVDTRTMVTLVLNRGRQQSPFTPDEVRTLQSLRPLFIRSLRTQLRVAHCEGLLTDLRAALDRLPIGVIIIDRRQRVRFASQTACRLLSPADGLAIKQQELRAEHYGPDRRLQSAITQALTATNGELRTSDDTLTVKRHSRGRDFEVLVSPLRGHAHGPCPSAPAALVLIRDPDQGTTIPWELVQQLYGLSPAESKLTVALANDTTLKEYARRADISVETARSQLKAAMSKTGTHRQVELIRLLLTGPAAYSLLDAAVPLPA